MDRTESLPLRALIVDDEVVSQKMLAFALEHEKFVCDTASDGVEGSEMFRRFPYDLVVTDLRMPNRSGRLLALELLHAERRPTVVVHTADPDPALTKDLMDLGVDDIVFKPVHYPAFAAKVRCVVLRRRESTVDLSANTTDTQIPAPPTAPKTAQSQPQLQDRQSVLGHDQRVLDGRYEIIREVGSGMTSIVYLARDQRLDRQVALKMLNVGGSKSEASLLRFQQEALAAAALRHVGICPIYDVGEVAGTRYIAMAYIDGLPLSDVSRRGHLSDERRIAAVVAKLAAALEHAHRRGIVHRDLKPSNVLVDSHGEPVITDFGLARRLGDDAVQLTGAGALVGTPAYMSPEQAQGDNQQIGPASDIYSLGVILFELLTGRYPYEGSVVKVLRKIVEEATPSPHQFRVGLASELGTLCTAMMAKSTSARPASMREVEQRLLSFLAG